MTDDQIWHQSTVMERCEILRSRLDSLSKMGPPTVPAFAAENAVVEEMARLKRIEAAARVVLENCPAMHGDVCTDWEAHMDLHAALDSEAMR